MDNQHRKISGYRELSEEEVALMNEIKAFGPQFEALLAKVTSHLTKQSHAARAPCTTAEETEAQAAELNRLMAAEPNRWANIAKTDLQKGLMALTRAVAQPTFF